MSPGVFISVNCLRINHIFKLIGAICLIGLMLDSTCFAADQIEIVKAQGIVTVSPSASVKPKKVTTKSILPSANILSTSENGRAVVRIGNTGYIVLEKNSQIEINTTDSHAGLFRHLSGLAYYAVNSIKDKDHTLEVKTKTSTIGIRGTRFLVTDVAERSEIGMRKGTISVTSLKGEFEIHKQSEQEEFEAMKKEGEAAVTKEKTEFEAYKHDIEHEFVEYKHELSLEANRMLSFDGNRVTNRPLNKETEEKLEDMESYAGKWLVKVQD